MSKPYTYTIPELKNLYENADEQIRLFEDKPTELILFKLSKSTWNIREVCEHLIAFGRLYLEQINRAISSEKDPPQNSDPFQPGWLVRKWAALFEPPYKLKIKTFPLMEPKGKKEIQATFNALHEVQVEVIKILQEAEKYEWDLEKIKGKNPVFRLMPMSLIDFLVLMEVHQRRHFWQIEQILKKVGEVT
ncbi:MAG: DinB family protein [Balneolaceae bacterium]